MPELGAICRFLGLFLNCYAMFSRVVPTVAPGLALITLEKEGHH
jgi:hypothetical protein